MCNCKLIYEKKLAEKYRTEAPHNESNHRAELLGYGFFFLEATNTYTLKPKISVEIKFDRTNKSGVSAPKKTMTFLVANYCPICGEKLTEQTEPDGATT